jgi:hypothetical protein
MQALKNSSIRKSYKDILKISQPVFSPLVLKPPDLQSLDKTPLQIRPRECTSIIGDLSPNIMPFNSNSLFLSPLSEVFSKSFYSNGRMNVSRIFSKHIDLTP